MSTRSLLLFSLVALAACAAEPSNDEDTVVEETEEELTKAGKALIGSYTDDGKVRALILTNVKQGQANEFIADVDTGIRCITQPCPSSERVTGTFTAGTKTITFKSSTASARVQPLLGKYNYLVQGSKLSLWRKGSAQSLAKALSYCAEETDCYKQDIIHPACMGQFDCVSNACSWSCVQWPPPPPPSSGTSCYSSESCGAGEYCTTEDGVCNSSGMLQVCSGTCEIAKK